MTRIEWTDAVWNPVVGCSRVSAGCEHCYAERVAHRAMQPAHAGLTVSGPKGPRWTGEVRCLPERLEQPLRWRKPRRVFVNSMSDLFHESVPDEFSDRVFAAMAACPQHTFQVLTKRPERMRAWFEASMRSRPMMRGSQLIWFEDGLWQNGERRIQWPLPNVWIGVSVEDQAAADERVPLLVQAPAALRFLSVEPLLGPVNLKLDGIGWVIVGGESGPGARACDVEWIRSVVRQARVAGVPCFVKQVGTRPFQDLLDAESPHEVASEWNLAGWPEDRVLWDDEGECWLPQLCSRKGSDPAEWPQDLRVREMPL